MVRMTNGGQNAFTATLFALIVGPMRRSSTRAKKISTTASILHNRDANGRVVKWSVELGALSNEFLPHSTIKSQALANFIAE